MESVLREFPPLCRFSRQSGLGEVDDVLGVLGDRSCCPTCSACSGVVVQGRVNEEENVLVVNGKCETNKG